MRVQTISKRIAGYTGRRVSIDPGYKEAGVL